MGFFTKDIKTLNDLFMHGLQDLYYAENQIMKSLPDMIEKATNAQLRAGFEQHLAETEGQVHRLRQVFELLDADPKGDKCPAIEGILREGRDLMSEIGDEDVMNVGLIAAAQAVEHYEITRYGALISWATELGRNDVVPLFKANLRRGEGDRPEADRDGGTPRQSEGGTEVRQAKAVEAEESQLAARRPSGQRRRPRRQSAPSPRRRAAGRDCFQRKTSARLLTPFSAR